MRSRLHIPAVYEPPAELESYRGAKFVPTVDQLVEMWLHSRYSISYSDRTVRTYRYMMLQFRSMLHQAGLDLDGDPSTVTAIAQSWSNMATRKSQLAASTNNGRLTCLSSFYDYCIKHGYLTKNPATLVDRRRLEYHNWARPFETEYVVSCLQAIERDTHIGRRDFALLSLAFTTGRRRAELRNLLWGDFERRGEKIVVIWRRTKGGKMMEDEVEPGTWSAILDYMRGAHGKLEAIPPSQPLWICFATHHKRGQLSTDSLQGIFKKRLGTGKVHSSRHTFAMAMEAAGAKLSEIGARLGHSNLSTTSTYLQRMHSAENPFASQLEESFGIAPPSDTSVAQVTDLYAGEGSEHPLPERLSNEKIDQILLSHPEKSDVEIAHMVHLSPPSICRRRGELGVTNSRDLRAERIAQALREHPERSAGEHARQLGVGISTVKRHRFALQQQQANTP